MTDELDDDTLERFAIEVEHLEPIAAQKEYDRMVAEERERGFGEEGKQGAKP